MVTVERDSLLGKSSVSYSGRMYIFAELQKDRKKSRKYSCVGVICKLMKKKRKFSSYRKNSDRSGCKVMYDEEGLSNI